MNRTVVIRAVTGAVLLAVSACGGSSSTGNGSSSGGGGGAGGMVFVCDKSGLATVNQCTKQSGVPSSALYSSLSTMCTQNGGTVTSSCPTSNVIGCCTQGDSEGCFYTGGTNPMTQAQCTAVGGTWSSAP